MKRFYTRVSISFQRLLARLGIGIRIKLIAIFLAAMVVPLVLLTLFAWQQITVLGEELRTIAVTDSSDALNNSAVENIERMTTDTANRVAAFLYARDDDLRYLATIEPTEENFRHFSENRTGRVIEPGDWVLSADGQSWMPAKPVERLEDGGLSTNSENNDMDGFHYRAPELFTYKDVPLYDEITFIGLDGVEQVKYVAPDSTKVRHPLSGEKKNVSLKANTYIKAENYFDQLLRMQPGDIYVSDVIGAYVGTNYIGMYTPETVKNAAETRGYDIPYAPEEQAYAGKENPNGTRFEGIVRFATPVADANGNVTGYVTFALNHDHIMEFVDRITPMNERYTQLPSAFDGNYAFIWDYNCRSICHPRHHSIVGYDPESGDPQIPWLESSIYDAWQQSGVSKWYEFTANLPWFDNQSREKTPAPLLTREGFVGLDGRFLNNAPQCTGWMDLTQHGGSGSFYILWSGLYKLNTAGAIPYYTGQYAPSEANNYSRRGFGFVAIGSGLEDFTRPAAETETKLVATIGQNLSETFVQLMGTMSVLIVLVVMIAILVASSFTGSITALIKGISRFRTGERQFRFNAPVKDEFGTLADSFDDMANSVEDSIKNPLAITTMNRRVIYMNSYGLALCKMSLEQIVGTDYRETSVYPANSQYDPITSLEQGRETEIYFDADTDRYIKGSASYLLDKNGNNNGYIIETLDVTDMVREQMKIEEQRTLLDKVFSASPDLIWYMDADGRYLTVNPRFSSIAGLPPEAFPGKRAHDILPAEIAHAFLKSDEEAISSRTPLYSEDTVVFADGHEESLDSVRTPIYDSNGNLTGLLGFARNVSARVSIENELRHTQLQLEKAVNDANVASMHKGDFLARMSHEIRTPMNAIIGITNIVQKKLEELRDGNEPGEVENHIDQIEASSQHLLGLLNDILDISKIEAGKIELSAEAMDLSKLAATVVSMIQPRCDEKNISFITEFDTFDTPAFLSDALRLRQVLINLLGNAVKFTPECGMITFSIRKLDRDSGKTLIGFSVKDNGIGVADEQRDTIFQPFEQGNRTVSRKYGGTGLGLAISRNIVRLFGGDIKLDSTLGEGSEFSFQLWFIETDADLSGHDAVSDVTGKLTGKRMLLVDDVEINRMIILSMLEGSGLAIDEASDGQEAVDMFAASRPYYYDIVLMDVQMPNLDGYEASDIIRNMNRADAGTVPILALTANAFKEDMTKALEHGMNAHISKPVEMETLFAALVRFLGRDS
ncbi:MAG: response regulator [Oscillospiraceae bacterium]|jgi:PAS domain S-box-containing protein|nr:response regulator [Oscillospiraceae bacterium]